MEDQLPNNPTKKRAWGKIALAVILVIALVIWGYFYNRPSGKIVGGITGDPEQTLTSYEGRTNVVFLGIGGEGHAGSDLTDSIIVFSYHHDSGQLTMIPLPRDIWITSMQAKINTAYHYGNERREGGGRDLAKSAVAETLGIPIHYALVLDFQGFEKMIDAVGGIDLVIDNSFEDKRYPIPGKETVEPESERYEHLKFEAGPAHLTGDLALKFARSRYAEGEEGTDFARSKRQEKVINAFKDKLLSSETWLNIGTLQSLVGQVEDSLDTDIGDAEKGAFIRIFLSYSKKGNPATSIDLTTLFYTPKNLSPYKGQWVLIPLKSIEEIYTYVDAKLSEE